MSNDIDHLLDEIQKAYRIERRLATTQNMYARNTVKNLILRFAGRPEDSGYPDLGSAVQSAKEGMLTESFLTQITDQLNREITTDWIKRHPSEAQGIIDDVKGHTWETEA